ncbi:hypothetical protein VaNZ11_016060, partial [Volvox africanus]
VFIRLVVCSVRQLDMCMGCALSTNAAAARVNSTKCGGVHKISGAVYDAPAGDRRVSVRFLKTAEGGVRDEGQKSPPSLNNSSSNSTHFGSVKEDADGKSDVPVQDPLSNGTVSVVGTNGDDSSNSGENGLLRTAGSNSGRVHDDSISGVNGKKPSNGNGGYINSSGNSNRYGNGNMYDNSYENSNGNSNGNGNRSQSSSRNANETPNDDTNSNAHVNANDNSNDGGKLHDTDLSKEVGDTTARTSDSADATANAHTDTKTNESVNGKARETEDRKAKGNFSVNASGNDSPQSQNGRHAGGNGVNSTRVNGTQSTTPQRQGNNMTTNAEGMKHWRTGQSVSEADSPKPPFSLRLARTGRSSESGLLRSGWLQGSADGGLNWGSVCFQTFGVAEATVACRQMALGPLGLPLTASWSGFAAGVPWPLADEMETLLNVQHCTGTESSLEDCARLPWGKQACVGDEGVAGVVCLADIDAVTSAAVHPVRLTGGSSPECGIVEIALGDGLWGTVCVAPSSASSSSSSSTAAASASGSAAPLPSNRTHPQAQKGKPATIAAAASVVCRQLGYTGGWLIDSAIASAYASVPTTAAQRMLPILSGMACQGKESSLLRCDHDGWGDPSACSNAGAGGRMMAVECYGAGSSRPPPAYPPHYHHHLHVPIEAEPSPMIPPTARLLPSYAPVENEPPTPTPRPAPSYAPIE